MEEQNCGVCLDVLKTETTAKLDGCIHQYHFSCIKEWADISNVCPLCKARFSLLTRLKDNSSVRIRGKDADFTHDQFYYSGEDEEADDFDEDDEGVDDPQNESDLSDFVVGDDVVEYESSYDGSEDEGDYVAASRRLNALAFDDEEDYFDDGEEDEDDEEDAEDAPFVPQKQASPWEILDVDEDEDDVCWRTLKAKPSRTSSLVRSFSESSSSSSSSSTSSASKTRTLKLRATSSSQPTQSSGEEKRKKKEKVEDLTVDSTEPPKRKLVKRSRSQINLVSSPPPTSSLPTSRSLPVAVIDLASTPEPKVVPPRKRRRVIDESCPSQVAINLENFPPSPSPLNRTTPAPTPASQEAKPRRFGPPKGPLTQWFARPPV